MAMARFSSRWPGARRASAGAALVVLEAAIVGPVSSTLERQTLRPRPWGAAHTTLTTTTTQTTTMQRLARSRAILLDIG